MNDLTDYPHLPSEEIEIAGIPCKVRVAMQFARSYLDRPPFCPEPSKRERAAHDAAMGVLIHYFVGENDYADDDKGKAQAAE